MPEQIPVGQILILRDEFDHVSKQTDASSSIRLRAARMVALLDELIERREKEIEASAEQQRCYECGHPFSEHGDGMEPACGWETCACTGFKPWKKEDEQQ
jgi:hypothetical protein